MTMGSDPLGGSVGTPSPLTLFGVLLMDAVTKLRVLRLSGYRCQARTGSGAVCGAPAALVVHPAPPPAPGPSISVCDHHAEQINAPVS
jgi:hypothetical protein